MTNDPRPPQDGAQRSKRRTISLAIVTVAAVAVLAIGVGIARNVESTHENERIDAPQPANPKPDSTHPPIAAAVAIEHASVLPMDRDTVLTDHTVIVLGDRISWVGPASEAKLPPNARRIDGRGQFLMPGLADMHVHLVTREDLRKFVSVGITTVRGMNGRPEHVAWRDSILAGRMHGPRIYTAGPSIFNRWWGNRKGFSQVRSNADADALVEDHVRVGYDMIKVLNGISSPVYERLIERARIAGIPVVGHVASDVGAARAIATQASLEHVESYIFDDPSDPVAGAQAIARAGVWVGTIIADRSGACAPPSPEYVRMVTVLKSAGVKFLAGSDANIEPIGVETGLHCELRSLVTAGLSPFETLAAATRNPGEFATKHLKERVPAGTVTVGSRADLLLAFNDPRADLRILERPVMVIVRGVPDR